MVAGGRVIVMDGSGMNVVGEVVNAMFFGYPGALARGQSLPEVALGWGLVGCHACGCGRQHVALWAR